VDEAALIVLARGGDGEAFGGLVELHQEAVFRAAFVITGSSDAARDVAQDAFVTAFAHLPRFRAGAPFRPWVLRIGVNAALNHQKSEARRRRRERTVALEPGSGSEPSVEQIVLSSERHRDLLDAIGRLSLDDRTVVAMRYLLDLDEIEMATALGCPRGTVKSRLSRALKRLRAELGEGVGETQLVGSQL